MTEPKLCPNCPYISFISIIKAQQVSYTRQKEELTLTKLSETTSLSKSAQLEIPNLPLLPRNRNDGGLPLRAKGKFWPPVRAMIWEKAQQLFQQTQARTMGEDFTGTTAERGELREAGYFYTAKLIVLRNLWLQKKGMPSIEEEEAAHGHF